MVLSRQSCWRLTVFFGGAIALFGLASCTTGASESADSLRNGEQTTEDLGDDSQFVTLTDPTPEQPPEPIPTSTATPTPEPTAAPTAVPEPTAVPFRTSRQVLADNDFDLLVNKRVGLISSDGSMLGQERFVDVLNRHPDIDLELLFAPEHGFRSIVDRGETIEATVDATTGIGIISLFGPSKGPSVALLEERLDVLVFDLQDVGARPYTYLSTMGFAMQSAALADIDFVVLDRRNPAGGVQIEGPVRTPEQESFVGLYPVPLLHGMTAGEIAQAIVGEQWIAGTADLDLTVVPVDGWNRDQKANLFRWTPPSPALTTATSGLAYPGAVLFEATSVSYGRGTDRPFLYYGAPWLDTDEAVLRLTELSMPGVSWRTTSITPTDPSDPNVGTTVPAIELFLFDAAVFEPVPAATGVLTVLRDLGEEAGAGPLITNPEFFDRLAGTRRFRALLDDGAGPHEISEAWTDEIDRFRALRSRYLLYPE